MLARWLRVQSGEEEKKQERRPHLASLCETLAECEKWRGQILREITKKVKRRLLMRCAIISNDSHHTLHMFAAH